MSETTVGFLIIGVGIILVLAVVYAVTARRGSAGPPPTPPPGVHLPPGSMLPVIMSVGALLIGAGLIFKPEEPFALPVLDAISRAMNPFIGIPGLLVLLYGVWGWVRAANREWRETESGSHHDAAEH
ncbi:MAG TPA: hypothetical protein VH987_08090 [Candidatus Limnocylindria bacterium]|jgi:hypothetical protein